MNKQKWLTAAAVVTLTATLAVAAPEGKQGHHGRRHGRGEFGARFAQKLNLSEAQKTQMRDVQKSFREQNKPLFEASKQTRLELKAAKDANDTARMEQLKATLKTQREQFKQARQAQHERVLALLTPDQRAQLDAMKAERKAKRENRQNHQQ